MYTVVCWTLKFLKYFICIPSVHKNESVFHNRYCAKLPSDAFTHLTPTYRVQAVETGERTMYVAHVRLPINSPVKMEIQVHKKSGVNL